MKPYPPLGILYLSSHLRRAGFDVEVYDSTFGSRADLIRILDEGPPSVIGIAANLLTRGSVISLVTAARAAGWTVIVGGPEPANYAAEYLEAGATKMGGEIENTQGRIGLHDGPLLGVLLEKIAVRQQQIHQAPIVPREMTRSG